MSRRHSCSSSSGIASRSRTHRWCIATVLCTMTSVVFCLHTNRVDAAEPQANYFVAVEGNDGWTGTLAEPNAEKTDGPFATLARARDAVRALKSAGPLAKPVMVMVREGTYYLDQTLVFGPEDSGTEELSRRVRRLPWRDTGGERRESDRGRLETVSG